MKNLETRYLTIFNNMSLDQGDFFFSYHWDLSVDFQTQIPQKKNPEKEALNEKIEININNNENKDNKPKISDERKVNLTYNDRFIWNTHILQPLLKATNNSGLIITIINGSVAQKNIELENRMISLVIISRRSRFYAGPRYLKRGLNFLGDVANEVETEQILFEGNIYDQSLFKISSFLHVAFKKFRFFIIFK